MASRTSVTLAVKVDTAARAVAAVEGRQSALAERLAAVERDVAMAKGRLALKPKVEEFLEQLQQESSRRNVGSYETLLNALVREVFPESKSEGTKIVLDLTTERGMPALDILKETDGKKDEREDVFEDDGGALTNVLCMGLRLIAAVKSKTAKFLLLDEADCWIESGDSARISAFYRVLKNAAAKLGVQCLVISHHDIAKFDSGIHVNRIEGFPKKGGTTLTSSRKPEWAAEDPGFRYVRFHNVQGFADARLELGSGITAVTGPNSRGKSAITRAFRAVFYGESRESLIRHGAKECVVDIGLADGRILRFSRARRRNPVSQWSLLEADETPVEENNIRFETGGKGAPDWVSKRFKIDRVEGLDVHLSHQKRPVFLLGEPPSKRAAVLSIGQEAGYIQDMLAIHKERCARDSATVRDGERQVAETRAAIEALQVLPDISKTVELARATAQTIVDGETDIERLETAARELERLEALASTRKARLAALAGLPSDGPETLRERIRSGARAQEIETRLGASERGYETSVSRLDALDDLPESLPALMATDHMLTLGASIRSATDALTNAGARLEILNALPSALPALHSNLSAEALASKIDVSLSRISAATAKRTDVNRRVDSIESEIEAVLAETGGACPACGQIVAGGASALLEGHPH